MLDKRIKTVNFYFMSQSVVDLDGSLGKSSKNALISFVLSPYLPSIMFPSDFIDEIAASYDV